MKINAKDLHFQDLNSKIRNSGDSEIFLENVIGQRYIGCGIDNKVIDIKGIPGNALGAYLDGCTVRVHGNAQDATGDTMNKGKIIIEGSTGDATGYAMRGGQIFVKGNAGYRAGIHMKAYQEHIPVLVIGNKAGDFLGEYQAGGVIIVLGLETEELPVGDYCAAGMHGGKIFIRGNNAPEDLPMAVQCKKATSKDMGEIKGYLKEYSEAFGINKDFSKENFCVLTPNTKNPYKQLYTHN